MLSSSLYANNNEKRVYGLNPIGGHKWQFDVADLMAMKVRGLVIWADEVKAKVVYIRNGPQVLHLNVDARFFSLFLSFEELSALASRGKFPEELISFRTITSHMVFEVQLEINPLELMRDPTVLLSDIEREPLVTMAIWGDCLTS